MASARPSIVIPLQGGLGNQLFELAAGIAAGQRTGRPVRYSDHWLRHPAAGETPRRLALEGLLCADELVTTAAARVGRTTDRLTGWHVIERSADDDALARVGRRTRVLAGYFQRLSYVEEAWPALRERFASSGTPAHRTLLETAPAGYGALHYRLGDYRANPDASRMHGATSPRYFAEAVREGYESLGLSTWKLVSDDPEAALELLRAEDLPPGADLVAPDSTDEWSDLGVLAASRFCAISNSSFSWWAAFLGSASHEMQVVAPRPWFADSATAEPVLFPAGWARRERSVMRG